MLPKKSQVVGEAKELVNRGVRQLQVFTGSNINYNYPEQYADAMRAVEYGDLLGIVFAEQSDHTFSRLDDRNFLIAEIADWLDFGFRVEQPDSS